MATVAEVDAQYPSKAGFQSAYTLSSNSRSKPLWWLQNSSFLCGTSQVNTVSGHATSFLEEVKTLQNYALHSWLSSIRCFLKYSQSTIKIYKAWTLYLQCEYNTMLVDKFEREKPGNATLDYLTKVCMYLGATSLANICNDEGK
eukprot:11111357-Ditylum_brightwellii.AAC.1